MKRKTIGLPKLVMNYQGKSLLHRAQHYELESTIVQESCEKYF